MSEGQDSATVDRTEDALRRAIEEVESARAVPMSASVMVSRDHLLDLLDDALENLPDELRAARWLLKERDDIRAKGQRDADALVADAASRVAQMVQRSEVVKAAEARAQEIIDEAEADARRMRHQAEDYCDQKLASFEAVLDRLSKTVMAGREKLASTGGTNPSDGPTPDYQDDEGSEASAFFDQDLD